MKSGEVTVAGNTPDGIQVNGLLAPEFGQDSTPFAEHMASPAIERYAKMFLGEQLRLGFVGLWVSDESSPYDSTWHRGVVPNASTVDVRAWMFAALRADRRKSCSVCWYRHVRCAGY